MHERRMIGRKFREWLETAYPDGPTDLYDLENLEAAFRAGYDTPECW